MLDSKHKRKVTAVPVVPKLFAEDQFSTPASPHDPCTPRKQKPLRVDELDFATLTKPRRAHTSGSVYHHAKTLVAACGSSAGTTDDSSLCSDVELIISELENLTQVSDASLNSTIKDCSEGEGECSDLQEAMLTVLEHNRRLMQERTQLRKSLFAKVMEKIDADSQEQTEISARVMLRKAVLVLVSDLSTRQDFLRALDTSSEPALFLLFTRGRVAGLYTQDKCMYFRLFGVENAPSVLRDHEIKRWFTWEAGRMKAVEVRMKKSAIAFDC